MATLAAIRDIWQEKIFDNDAIVEVTSNVFDFDVPLNSQFEISRIYYQQEINYIEYKVVRSNAKQIGGRIDSQFSVIVTVTRAADPQGINYNKISDLIETLQSLVRTELTSNWGGVVDDSKEQSAGAVVEYAPIADVPCWRCRYEWVGYKFNNGD